MKKSGCSQSPRADVATVLTFVAAGMPVNGIWSWLALNRYRWMNSTSMNVGP